MTAKAQWAAAVRESPERALKPNANCAVCQAAFYASPGHVKQGWGTFCSIKCRSVARRAKTTDNVTCKGCGAAFHVKPFAIREGKGRVFCSRECQQRAQGMRSFTCQTCGSVAERFPSQGELLYCSSRCASQASRKPRVTLTCVNCGEQFQRLPHVLVKNKGSGSFCSNRCKAAFMSSSSITVSGAPRGTRARKGGLRPDIGIYVRSAWEANYARYLNWLVEHGKIVSWEYEPQTFEFTKIRRGSRFYTPDFKIVNSDGSIEYHEVKGYMDARSATKLRRMRKYYPMIKLIVIDQAPYKELCRKVGPMIEGWEQEARRR